MADIREIDMPKATDANGKKIRLVGDDGKGYWMEFSDLAAVVGGRLGSLGLYPFMYRGLVSGDLFNDDLEDGYYTINIDSMAVTNNPCGYGVLIKKTGNFNYSTMEVADILNNVKYMTVRNNRDTWKPWRQE